MCWIFVPKARQWSSSKVKTSRAKNGCREGQWPFAGSRDSVPCRRRPYAAAQPSQSACADSSPGGRALPRAPFAESTIPPKQLTHPKRTARPPASCPKHNGNNPHIDTTIRLCYDVKRRRMFRLTKKHKPLEASSGQGENPYRRYSPRTDFVRFSIENWGKFADLV